MNEVKKKFLKKDFLKLAKRSNTTVRGDMVLGNNEIRKNRLTVHLAEIWGFCYGVLYALEEVGEILEKNPDKNIWVLGDLIHNPLVNSELKRLGAKFLELGEIDRVEKNDIVVIPAFGTHKEVLADLKDSEVELIDTTCSEVKTVEQRVREFNQAGYTVVIHGKYTHQETKATCSYADRYLIIRNLEEAKLACDYMLGKVEREKFVRQFKNATPADFDPDSELQKIGLANQTTMLMNDSLEIFNLFRETVRRRDGDTENIDSIETICSATQDRQDAVVRLLQEDNFDLFLVVGGHNSSNTQNLARTVNNNADIPVYHIQSPEDFNDSRVKHLPPGESETTRSENWLPGGEIKVGLTAGASTPHSQLEKVLIKLLDYF